MLPQPGGVFRRTDSDAVRLFQWFVVSLYVAGAYYVYKRVRGYRLMRVREIGGEGVARSVAPGGDD